MRSFWIAGALGLASCSLPSTVLLDDAGIDGDTSSLHDSATCEAPCSVPFGTGGCALGGMCVGYVCAAGHYDLDRLAFNGCEYACMPSPGPDVPDPMFMDTNCDGIDGDVSHAIFVSAGGSSLGDGSMAHPYATIAQGIGVAASFGKDVYVDRGSYTESVTIVSGVSVYGGFDSFSSLPGAPPGFWGRDAAAVSTVHGGNIAVVAMGLASPTTLEAFTIVAANGQSQPSAPGAPSIGVLVTNGRGAALTIQSCIVTAGNGAAGASGGTATAAVAGPSGNAGSNGYGCSADSGGTPGTNMCADGSANGGTGGASATAGGAGSDGATSGSAGMSVAVCGTVATGGGSGGTGATGATGLAVTAAGDAFGTVVSGMWTAANGTNGNGGHHGGGGGGGGGGGNSPFVTAYNPGAMCGSCVSPGFGGAGGGAGGCGGGAGPAGMGGGASFAVAVFSASAVLEADALTAGTGGAAGNGSPGSAGAGGGMGGASTPVGSLQTDGAGAAGGNGGHGGGGSPGSGGGGGPSFVVAQTSDATVQSSTTSTASGTAGMGGMGATSSGITAPNGAMGAAGLSHTYNAQ